MIFAETIASSSDPVVLALVAIVATVITALFRLLNANTKALANLVISSEKVANATDKGSREAKQRNGHLGEQNLKLAELVNKQNQDISVMKDTGLKSLQANARVVDILSKSAVIAAQDRDVLTTNSQVITEQTVQHQTIKSKEVK